MLSSLNLESLFSEAMSQHLALVQQLDALRPGWRKLRAA